MRSIDKAHPLSIRVSRNTLGFLKIMPRRPATNKSAQGKSRPSSKRKPSGQPRTPTGTRQMSSSLSSAHRQRPPSSSPTAGGRGKLWLYGRHAVEAALKNPRRTCHQLLATDEALDRLDPFTRNRAPEIRRIDRSELDAKLGEHVVHQGLALAVAPLPQLSLEKVVGMSASAAST